MNSSASEPQEKTTELKVIVDPRELETKAVDKVQVQVNGDSAIVNFIQLLPPDSDGTKQAKIISRVSLPWPLFGRTAKLFNLVFNENAKMVQERLNEIILGNEDNEPKN